MSALDELETLAHAASPGPWFWWGDRKQGMYLGRWGCPGKTTVMDFVRQGMSGAQPRFAAELFMVKAEDLAVKEVAYREDIVDIDHPDARFIAAANPAVVLGLIARVKELESATFGEDVSDPEEQIEH